LRPMCNIVYDISFAPKYRLPKTESKYTQGYA
jgi:hypothetical protein